MRKFSVLSALLVSFILMVSLFSSAATAESTVGTALPDDVVVSARSAIVIGLGSVSQKDTVVFERDADTPLSPAAMVRLMAGIYALKTIQDRNIPWDTVSGTYTADCAASIASTNLATVGMKVGDTWTVKDLLTVTLVSSAADAAVSMAAAVSGTLSGFVRGMNDLAKEIGCVDTSFTNVTGLDAPGQRTTARDMAKITRYAMDFPELQTMLATDSYTGTPLKGAELTVVNVNSMVRSGVKEFYTPGMLFGRTGFSDTSGRCMASVAKDGGYTYLVVVMGCTGADGKDVPTAHFADTKALYAWAFSQFTYKTVLRKNQPVASMKVDLAWNTDKVTLLSTEDVVALVSKDLDISNAEVVRIVPTLTQAVTDAPIEKDAVYGRAALYIKDAQGNEQLVGETDLVAGENLPRSEVLLFWRWVKGTLTSPWLYLGILLLIGLIAAYAVTAVRHNRLRRRRKTKR